MPLMTTAVLSEQLGEDLGGDKRPEARSDLEHARDVGQVLETLAGPSVGIRRRPDLPLENVFDGRVKRDVASGGSEGSTAVLRGGHERPMTTCLDQLLRVGWGLLCGGARQSGECGIVRVDDRPEAEILEFPVVPTPLARRERRRRDDDRACREGGIRLDRTGSLPYGARRRRRDRASSISTLY